MCSLMHFTWAHFVSSDQVFTMKNDVATMSTDPQNETLQCSQEYCKTM